MYLSNVIVINSVGDRFRFSKIERLVDWVVHVRQFIIGNRNVRIVNVTEKECIGGTVPNSIPCFI